MKKVYWLFLLISIFALSGIGYAQDAANNNGVDNNSANINAPASEAVEPVSVGISAQTEMPQQPDQQAISQQSTEPALVKGNVEEVASDGAYLVIAGTKVLTTKEMIEDAYVEVGDKVEASVQETAEGKKLINLKYIFDDEEPVVDTNAAVVPNEPAKTEAQQ